MKNALVLILTLALIPWIGCGGGEQKTETKPAAEQPSASTAAGGYAVISVTNGGSITGRVTYAGQIPEKVKLEVTKDVNVCGKVEHYKEDLVVSSDRGLANVVVSLKSITQGKDLAALGETFELDQKGCMFVPHITLVPVGAELTILNSDGILHNIHTFSSVNEAFNKAQPPYLKKMKATFEKPEIIQVKCDVHAWMSGYIVAADHPYYAITDANGRFEITDVPPGTYTVEYWQEKLGAQSKEVTVEAGAAADASFEFASSTASVATGEKLAVK